MKRTPPDEPKARESGSGPVRREPAISKPPPPPPQASRFEPLPLGANAFAPPVFTASAEEEPKPWRKAMPWLVLAGIAGASGLAVWIAMIVNQPASKDDVEQNAATAEVADVAQQSPEEEGGGEQTAVPAAEAQADKPVEGEAAAAAPAQPAAEPPPAAEADVKDEAEAEDKADGRSSAARAAAREKRHAARAAKAAAAAPRSLAAAPSRTEVIAAMAGVHAAAVRCMDGAHGVVTADMKILGTGRVASVNVSGAPGKAGSCIAGAVRKAKFPEFSAASIAVRYPMKL
jgi:hypothetical protein